MANRKRNQLNRDIAVELRRIRKQQRLTIEELASLSEVSGITISNIENGRSNPTLNSLWKLADTLQVPLTKLLGYSHSEKEISSVSRESSYFMNDLEKGWVVQPVFQEENIEVFQVCLKANSNIKRNYQMKNSIEIITVMSGFLELIVGDKSYTLGTYDSINFDSGCEHEYINNSNEDVFLNIVVKYNNI